MYLSGLVEQQFQSLVEEGFDNGIKALDSEIIPFTKSVHRGHWKMFCLLPT